MIVAGKLEALVGGAEFDVCGYDGLSRDERSPLRFIHRTVVPGRGTICLLKVLQTNVCTNDCAYCANQIGLDCPRYSFKPDELARLFMDLYSKRLVRGLFLTSGIAGNPSRTMESMINTVEILRHRHKFDGYVHLKILPGASFDCVEEACKLASRVSVNMEAPTVQHLAKLSSKKDLYQGILDPMRWVKKLTSTNDRLAPAGQTTQFVVGAAGETDRDILRTTEALYREMGLRRVYFSAYRPITGSRLEGKSPTPPLREHRLYQIDWLVRVYGFSPQEAELALEADGNLSFTKDPKVVIAQGQPWLFPMDVNVAGYDDLLRVPGIGPIAAKRIVESRKDHSIFSFQQLKRMQVNIRRAAPFLRFQGMLLSERQGSFLTDLDDGVQPNSLAALVGRSSV